MSRNLIPTQTSEIRHFIDGQVVAALAQSVIETGGASATQAHGPANTNTPVAADEEEYAEVYFAHG